MSATSRVLGALVACVAAGALTGCAQVDLTRAAFQRTTIPATSPSGGAGGAANSEPTDPAFSVDKLRKLEPCQLLDREVLRSYGAPITDPLSGLEDCFTVLRDDKDGTLSVSLDVGESSFTTEEAKRQLAGLPLTERRLAGSDACFETVLTNRSPELGITVQTGYAGGDPCRPAREVLEQVVQRVRTDPPQRADLGSSITQVDPCQTLTGGDVERLVGDSPEVSPTGLWSCTWNSDGVSTTLRFDRGADPSVGVGEAKQKKVTVAGVTGYQRAVNYGVPSCTLSWAHRPVDDEYETVRIEFSDSMDGKADACGKARQVAGKVIARLPKP